MVNQEKLKVAVIDPDKPRASALNLLLSTYGHLVQPVITDFSNIEQDIANFEVNQTQVVIVGSILPAIATQIIDRIKEDEDRNKFTQVIRITAEELPFVGETYQVLKVNAIKAIPGILTKISSNLNK